MIGNVVTSEVGYMYVVLGKAEKRVPYVQLLGATKHMML